jgi:hypothetical protein
MYQLTQLKQHLRQLFQRVQQRLHKERTVENNQPDIMYTEEQLMARLKFFIGICLSLTLFGIVFVVLYSLIFVTQPLNAISPIDQKFFELIVPIATFLTGTLSGIMLAGNNPEAQQKALEAANKGWDRPPSPTPTNGGSSNGGFNSSSGGSPAFGSPASASGFGGFGSPAATAAPTASSSFGGSAGGVPSVDTGFGGKKVVPEFPQPLL